ncbi:sirohydrochlorin cobaltochelatase [Fundidesulfovibrio magnetotacticus]|uniref:sirohydrochlorin cobaltochelatase n=1 Tax=Fundidesulfovibrio magnetotacticus TaxID=2730080 RepID=UPI001566707D|nr:sirohydrochlorin cobaltochelatase [Fundidesulfovibrio magnetotacticus]
MKVLVVAAHGSSHPLARAALGGFADHVRALAPDRPIHLAYTAFRRSGNHPASAGAQERELPRVLEGLERLGAPVELAVLSLHVVAGDEFERTRLAVEAFARGQGVPARLSGPLLARPEDAPQVARALAGELKALPPGEAAVLMGHGAAGEAQQLYRELARELQALAPLARLGVLEAADPADPLHIRAMAADLAARGVRRATLAPLLTVAGRHAHKDLAGEQPGSWRSALAAHGIDSPADLRGLVEREAFRALWAGRLAGLLA